MLARSFAFALVMLAMLATPATAQESAVPALQIFHAAVARGDEKAVATLLKKGIAFDSRNAQGETALLIAVQQGRTRIAELLIARGADINAQAQNRDTPWLLAGARGHTAILAAMLPKGPDYRLRNRFGGSALIPACHYGHVETVRFLTSKSKIDVDHVNDLGWTCLLEAILLGDGGPAHQEIVRIVLAAGANPNLADRDGVTALAHARKRGQGAISSLMAGAGGR